MPNVGTITGSMYLDPSAYISGLSTAAGATQRFQQGVSTISFAGFHRGIFATTTLLYGLERIMSNMSKGMEEYANMLGRIGTVADLTASSVYALADSMKAISVYQGVSRKDIMGGMYTAAQAGYQTPAEMRAMATSGARLSRASGKEIDVKKSVDLQSGIRQALGIGMGSVSSNRMNDVLLKGRDIGRWELDQMAHALGIPLTVWGNQFAGKQSGEETLRQLLSVMSVASLAGVSPNMTATGTRRIVERTVQLAKPGKMGDPLRAALRNAGFGGENPTLDALNQGGMKYLNTLMGISGGGQTSELTRLGYGSRDLLVLTSAMRGKGEKLNSAYEELSYGNAAGTTERYGEKMRGTYDYQRDPLRAQWELTSQAFMQATIPLISQFVNMLEGLNKAAQALPESVKSFMLLIGALSAARLALNFLGFRSKMVMPSLGGGAGAGLQSGGLASAMSVAAGGIRQNVSLVEAQTARLARRQAAAAGRPSSWYLTGQASPMWNATNPISDSAPSSLAGMQWKAQRSSYGIADRMRVGALGEHYAPYSGVSIMTGFQPGYRRGYGATTEQRIRWAAYKRGQSVNFDTGSYGSLSPAAMAYANRGTPEGSTSFGTLRGQALGLGNAYGAINNPLIKNMGRQAAGDYGQLGFSNQLGRYAGASGAFAEANVRPNAAAYSAMGIGGAAQAVGAVSSGLSKFSSGLWNVIGPLAKFSGVLLAVNSIYEGLTYKRPAEEAEGGMTKMVGGDLGFNGATAIPNTLRMALAGWFNKDEAPYMAEAFGRKYGAVADGSGKGWSALGSFMRTGTGAMAGFRDATMNDVMGIASREQLSPGMVRKLRKGGINFNDFGTAKGYLKDHLTGLGKIAPDNWETWLRSTKDGINTASQLIADALKGAADKIAASTAVIPTVAQTPWDASISQMTLDAVARQRLLAGRQWDIYSGADYSGRGNGGLQWGAEGMRYMGEGVSTPDLRLKYNAELGNLDTRFGGFTDQSYSANARAGIEGQRKTWNAKAKGVGATFGGFNDNPSLQMMVQEGDEDFARMKKIREFLKVMPDIGTMPVEQAQKQFMSLTGRDDMTDVYAKANFDNFRNMDVSKYVSAETVKPASQFASATQFGTSEAYNQLLQRDDPTVKMNVAVDKLIAYLETLRVKKEDVAKELAAVAKAAKTFFDNSESTNFFANMQDMAITAGD